MNHSNLISFIVPFQKFDILSKNLLESFHQHTNNIEVIFVHDSKIALSQYEIQQLSLPNSRGIYLHGEFNSPGLARNRGLAVATGEWIVFWDSDDFGYPDVFAKIVSTRETNAVVANFCVSPEQGLVSKRTISTKVSDAQISINPGLWRFIFSAEYIKHCRFRNLKLGEDVLFLIESGIFEEDMEVTQEIVYEYRNSDYQSTKNMDIESRLEEFIKVLVEEIKVCTPRQKITYGIYWRQMLSLLQKSRGKKIVYCSRITLNLIQSMGPIEILTFLSGLQFAFRKSLV